MKLARYTFFVAGVFGLIVLATAAYVSVFDRSEVMPSSFGSGLTLYGYLLQFAVLQALNLILASDPTRFRPMMIPAALLELFAPLNGIWLYFYGVNPWLALTIVFMVFAALFFASYHQTRSRPQLSAA